MEFGRPGDSDADQPVAGPADGPGDGAWRVLVGFVRFDTAIGRFSAVGTSADGVSVTPAGARAGLVASASGRVEIRVGRDPGLGHTRTRRRQPTRRLTHLRHARRQRHTRRAAERGLVRQRHCQGHAQRRPDRRLGAARRGTAFDGTVLPLPAGVDQATVDSGGLEVSILVTPRLPDPAAAPNAGQLFLPVRCEVDADRRVSCVGTWFQPGIAGGNDEAAACDFLVLVSVPGGGAP